MQQCRANAGRNNELGQLQLWVPAVLNCMQAAAFNHETALNLVVVCLIVVCKLYHASCA
jgi:hypothetical protein